MSDQIGTPSSHWKANGEPDPHGSRYDCERASLAKGHLTDDEIANGVFMADPRFDLNLISWQQAAKDRIRWLSRALDAAEASIAQGRADERETGEAYMRLRNIIGREAFRTPHGVSHFDVTEAALKEALAARNVTATITFDKTDIAEMLTATEAEQARAVEAERERCAALIDCGGCSDHPCCNPADCNAMIAAAIRTGAKP